MQPENDQGRRARQSLGSTTSKRARHLSISRFIRPTSSIVNSRVSSEYNCIFVCKDYLSIGMSQNTVSASLLHHGQDGAKLRLFYQSMIMKVAADYHVAINSMLKQDTSTVNNLSAFSYKAGSRATGMCLLSMRTTSKLWSLFVLKYSPATGSMQSLTAHLSWIMTSRAVSLLRIRGFPPVRIIQELGDRPNLHILTPIKRNDVRIGNNDVLTFECVLEGIGDHVLYKKSCIKGDRYIYAYKSDSKAAIEEADYLSRREKNKDFATGKYKNTRSVFGVIVFESDLDKDPKTVYLSYDELWMLELVFRQYNNNQCLDRTNVQVIYSPIGSEYINFIATVATCQLIARARDAGLLNRMSYKVLIDDLSSA